MTAESANAPVANGAVAPHRILKAMGSTADEKPGLWPLCDQYYASHADYRASTRRDIPIFVCDELVSDTRT